jgi:hypothetical protein
MTAKIAKPIVKNKSWLLIEDGRKVGSVNAVNRQYLVKFTTGQQEVVPSADTIRKQFNVEFEKYQGSPQQTTIVSDYPTVGSVHNPVYDIMRRIPMYTQQRRSRCWYAAGYYAVNYNGNWCVELCPKIIHLARNPFCGPFKTRDEADEVSSTNTLV